jgi:beta-lactamase regulating signal transducer with metallopeptidase domain
MIIYLLKSACCLALLLGFYHLVLEKEKMHSFNRFFLLGSIIFSFLAPLYTIYTERATITEENTPIVFEGLDTGSIEYVPTEIITETPINYSNILLAVYLLVSLILLIRFSRNFYKILSKIHQSKKIIHDNAILVLVEDEILPHTFWNYIFINKRQYELNEIEDELFTHELTHATQKHTLDILILELFQIVFWINPLFIFLKKAIQINHEFLADENVITQHNNTQEYQYLLLNKAAWKNEYYLASNLNYLVTKKRLKMMTTTSSPTKILLKKLAIAPLLLGFIFLFAQRVEAQEIKEIIEEPIETIVEEVPFKKMDLSTLEIYKNYYYKNLTIQRKDKNGKTIVKKYSELNDEEKKRLAPPPPLKSKKIIPTKAQFEALKDNKKFAVWIDGKVVKNKTLNNYNHTDFAWYFNSHVYKNARSERFPQENQASLQTLKYFNTQNTKRIEKFIDYVKDEYNIIEIEEIKEKLELKEIKEQPKKKKYNLPSSNGSKQSSTADIRLKLKDLENLDLIFLGKDSILYNYNFLAKKYNNIPVEKRVIKLSDLKKLESLYKNISKEEKINAEPFPECYLPNKKTSQKDPKFNKGWFITIDGQKYYYTFDKNERIARYYKNGKFVNLDIVKEYKKKQKIFESLKAEGKHYIHKNKADKAEIDREYSDLGGMFFRMSRADKNKVSKPQNPIRPYIRLMKNDIVFYKLRKDLTKEDKLLFPPPPAPMNASKEEKQKAKMEFENWKKRTGNTLNKIPPAPKKAKKKRKQKVDQKNVAKSLKVKDTIPKKKKETKITLKNIETLEEKSFNLALQNLTEEEKKKNRENVTYYIDGKIIKYNELKKIDAQKIKSMNVIKNKDGSKSIYITRK